MEMCSVAPLCQLAKEPGHKACLGNRRLFLQKRNIILLKARNGLGSAEERSLQKESKGRPWLVREDVQGAGPTNLGNVYLFTMASIEGVLKFHSLHPRVKLFVPFPYEKKKSGREAWLQRFLSPQLSPRKNIIFIHHLSKNSFDTNNHRKRIIVRLEEQESWLLLEPSTK